MPAKLFQYDFCKRRLFTTPTKTIELPQEGVAMATGLGCNIPISTGTTDGQSVVRTVDRNNGREKAVILASEGNESYANPGASTWMTGLKTRVLTGSANLPFPVSRIQTDYIVSFQGVNWLQDNNGIGTHPDVPALLRLGFTGNASLVRTVLCSPGNKEYDVGNRVKALHSTRHYARFASVGGGNESLSIAYDDDDLIYHWPTSYSPGLVQSRTRQVSATSGSGGWFYNIRVRIWGVMPARIGHSSLNFYPNASNGNGSGVDGNGPQQDRRFSYEMIDALTAPDYGGSMSGSAAYSGFRPGVVLYTDEGVTGTRHAEMFINGELFSSTAATIPTPQKSDFQDTILGASFESVHTINSNSIGSFTITVQTPRHLEIGDDFEETVGTFTFNDPLPGLYYEGLVYFHQGTF